MKNLTICWDILHGQSAAVYMSKQTLVSYSNIGQDLISCEIFDKEILRDFTSE
jgi:hypothetical protein